MLSRSGFLSSRLDLRLGSSVCFPLPLPESLPCPLPAWVSVRGAAMHGRNMSDQERPCPHTMHGVCYFKDMGNRAHATPSSVGMRGACVWCVRVVRACGACACGACGARRGGRYLAPQASASRFWHPRRFAACPCLCLYRWQCVSLRPDKRERVRQEVEQPGRATRQRSRNSLAYSLVKPSRHATRVDCTSNLKAKIENESCE